MKTKKQLVKQKIAAVGIVAITLLMTFGSLMVDQAGAANQSNTILQQIVQGSPLSIEGPTQVNFATVTLNTIAVNSAGNITQVNMRDPRGTGAGWAATGSANNLQAANGAIIANSFLRWAPGTIYALDGSSNTGVVAGTSYLGNFSDGVRTLANTSTGNGMGNYVINGTMLNLMIAPSTYIGTYQNTLTLTIS
jgi:hypothetical protein